MRLMVELEGGTVPLSACDWVLFMPCGCPRGVARVDPELVTEDAAWKEFYPLKRDRERAQRQGHRFELMTHKQYVAEIMEKMRLSYKCPHPPTARQSSRDPGQTELPVDVVELPADLVDQ